MNLVVRRGHLPSVVLIVLGALTVGVVALAQTDPFRRVLVISQPLDGVPIPLESLRPATTTSGLANIRPLTKLPLPSGERVLGWELASADLVDGPFGSFVSLKYASGDKHPVLVLVRPLDPQPGVPAAGHRSEVVEVGSLRGLLVYGDSGPAFPRPSGASVDDDALVHRMSITVELPHAAVTVVADDRSVDRDDLIAFMRTWLDLAR